MKNITIVIVFVSLLFTLACLCFFASRRLHFFELLCTTLSWAKAPNQENPRNPAWLTTWVELV